MRGLMWIPFAALLVAGCGGSDDYVPPSDDDDADIVSCMDRLQASIQEVDAAAVVTVDWSQVTEDLDGEALDPAADLDQLEVAFMQLAVEDAAEDLCKDAVRQNDIVLLVQDNSVQGHTSAEMDVSTAAGTVAGLVLSGGDTRRLLALAEIVAGSPHTVITLTD